MSDESERNAICLHCGKILTKSGIKFHLREGKGGICPKEGSVPSPKYGKDWARLDDKRLQSKILSLTRDIKTVTRAPLVYRDGATVIMWLKENRKRVITERLSQETITEELEKVIGKKLSAVCLKNLLDIAKIELKKPSAKEVSIQLICKSLVVLAKAVINLYAISPLETPKELRRTLRDLV